MKKISLLISCLFAFAAHAQMVFEHTYDSLTYGNMINLSAAGSKYVMINVQPNSPLRIYNLDHTVYRTINIAQIPGCGAYLVGELVSDHLFNADNLIEILVKYTCSPNRIMVQNENGQILDSVLGNEPDLYRDNTGRYKLLVREDGEKLNVYDLPGTIPCVSNCGVIPLNTPSQQMQQFSVSEPVPNPASLETVIYFTLPPGENNAAISLFNMNGQFIRSYKLKSTDKQLKINTADLPPGSYYYYLDISGHSSKAKKLIILN